MRREVCCFPVNVVSRFNHSSPTLLSGCFVCPNHPMLHVSRYHHKGTLGILATDAKSDQLLWSRDVNRPNRKAWGFGPLALIQTYLAPSDGWRHIFYSAGISPKPWLSPMNSRCASINFKNPLGSNLWSSNIACCEIHHCILDFPS